MIQVNMLQDAGGLMGAVSQARPAAQSTTSRSSSKALRTLSLVAILLILGFVGSLLWLGVPKSIAPYIPQEVVAALGLQLQESSNAVVVPEASAELVATAETKGTNISNDAVEEVVKTVRPDVFYERERKEYRQLLPAEKILYQRTAIAQAFTIFRAITPQGFGFTDLVFKMPDLYYARGLASDDAGQKSFLDSLKRRSTEFAMVQPPEGQKTHEFTAYGRLAVSKPAQADVLNLMTATEASKELAALSALASKNGVKLQGLENPRVESSSLYRRAIFEAQTRADFPALQSFAEDLRKSNLRVGILQVVIRPSVAEGLITQFDFVMYTSPK